MTVQASMLQAGLRKIAAAAIAAPIFSLLLGVLLPNLFGERAERLQENVIDIMGASSIYMLYSFPVLLVYGGLTSLLSDFLAKSLAANTSSRLSNVYSAVFHLGFGLILAQIGLLAAAVFFAADRLLAARVSPFNAKKIAVWLLIPIFCWLLLMSPIWIRG